MSEYVPSESDERVVNNTLRHQYRVLSEDEKMAMLRIKDLGAAFIDMIEHRTPKSREASIAKTKIEEAVMWAIKGLTS